MTYGIWPDHSQHLCSYNFQTEECDYVDYGLRMGFAYFFPGVLFAVLATGIGVVLLSIYCCCRCCSNLDCCKICLWGNPLHWCNLRFCELPSFSGFCCRRARLWRGVIAALAVITAVFLLVAIGVDSDVFKATNDWESDSVNFVQDQLDAINNIEETIKSYEFYDRINATVQDVISQTRGYIDDAQTVVDYAKDFKYLNLGKFIVEVIFVALLLLFSVGGCVLVAFGYKIPYIIYIVFLLLALVPLFLFFSYNVLAERLYADVCDDNDITIAGGNSAIKNGILPCNSSGIESLRQEYYGLINESTAYTCELIEAECTLLPFVFCGSYFCTNSTVWNAPTSIIIEDTLACGDPNCPAGSTCNNGICYQKNVTEEVCATSCLNEQARNISNYTVTGVEELSEFFALMEETVVPIITCHILVTYDEEIKNELCDHMINCGVVALFLMFAGVTMILAAFWTCLAHNTLAEGDDDEDWDL